MIVGFLILNYNSWEMSLNLANKVVHYSSISKVLIVDNCSTDPKPSGEPIISSKIIIESSEKNGGYSYGNNYGVKRLCEMGCDFVFISNPDVDIDENDVDLILAHINECDYSVLSGVEFNSEKRPVIPAYWHSPTYLHDLRSCFILGRLAGPKENVSINKKVDIQQVDVIKGSFMCVNTHDFWDVGGFDDNVFLYCEERILARRMKNKGYKLGLVTKAKYYHNHKSTINKSFNSSAKRMKLLYNSRRYYNIKYNSVNGLQLCILNIAMAISVFEYSVAGLIKTVFKKNSKQDRGNEYTT